MSGKAILLNYIKFAVFTLCGTTVDMLLLWVCSHYLFTDYFGQYILSPSISFEGAVLTNYVVACHFVWHNRVSGESLKYKVLRFFGYNVSCLSGFAVKMGFLLLLQRLFAWDVLICNIVALVFSGLFNFVIQEFVVFRTKTHRPSKKTK